VTRILLGFPAGLLVASGDDVMSPGDWTRLKAAVD